MSQIIQLQNEGLERHFRIFIPVNIIKEKIDQKIISLTVQANMPGFRKFKAGANITSKAMQAKQLQIRKQYETSIKHDVQNEVIAAAVDNLIKSNNFSLIGNPSIEINNNSSIIDVEQNSNIEGSSTTERNITVDVKFTIYPEIKIPDFSQITIKKHIIQVTKEYIDELIDSLHQEIYEYKDCLKQEKATKGKKLVVDIVVTGDEIENHNKENIEFILGNNNFISEAIEGKIYNSVVGDELEISTILPDTYFEKKVAGKLANLKITVKKIQQPIFITEQQLLEKHQSTSIDDLKAKVREFKNVEFMNLSQMLLRARLLNQLDKVLDYELPKVLLNSEYAIVKQNVLAALKDDSNNGIKIALNQGSAEDIEQYCQFIAARRVRISLFILHYANQKNITVTSKDKTMLLMQRFNKSQEEATAIINTYNHDYRLLLNSLTTEAMEIKVINHILENEVKIIEEPCIFDDIEGFADEISKDMGLSFPNAINEVDEKSSILK
ncbi:trigger factor [Orientia chuto str. Dubai]|uniref:Trigger factor n=1 Tax=Orientia chuto str. Dubai TaxID=1359168 RepID=A0A0F3MGC7_9RICK|nr:trigger factor [Candidatus Orientia mediorientalis]KJV54823.1 trigger factor [Orientia chuto str. Dubai]